MDHLALVMEMLRAKEKLTLQLHPQKD